MVYVGHAVMVRSVVCVCGGGGSVVYVGHAVMARSAVCGCGMGAQWCMRATP